MLKYEFRPIDGKVLTIGRSPKEKIYMVPKAVFDLPKKERGLISWDCTDYNLLNQFKRLK
ncbi:TPA: hypothetical protein ACOKXA_000143 [Streptococcus pneumoniae]